MTGCWSVRPGIGTVVADVRPVATGARRLVLEDEAERLVVAAKRAGVSLQDVLTALRRHWTRTSVDALNYGGCGDQRHRDRRSRPSLQGTRSGERADPARAAGSVFALVGPNGAGKTTTIKMLMNLIRPSRRPCDGAWHSCQPAGAPGVSADRLRVREPGPSGLDDARPAARLVRPFYPTWDRGALRQAPA